MYKIINNYKINAFKSKEEFLQKIVNQKKILVAMNAEKIVKDDKVLMDIVNKNIGYPDGFGAVIALRRNGLESIKIAGSEFWLEIIQKFHKTKSFYLIGSTPEVIEETVQKLKREYPNINIVGYQNGFLKEGDKERLIINLQKEQPDIIFVAQGSPKQELLMNDLSRAYSALYMGLGGSFDIYGGSKKRAPLFFLKFELEWFYRLLQEPTRIGRQFALIKFFILMSKQQHKKSFS